MRWALRVYGQGVKVAFASAMAYRMDFIFTAFLSLAGNMGLPLVTVLIYSAGASIPGWGFHEALLLQAVFTMSTGLSSMLFFSLTDVTMYRIREGSYDLLMIKPGPLAFLSISQSFQLEGIGTVLGGLVLFLYSLSGLPFPGVLQWFSFLFLFGMGILVQLGCVLLMSATAFKWVGNSRIFEIFNTVTGFGRYPGSIFPKAFLHIISYVLPMAMLGFFPGAALLGNFSRDMFLSIIPCLLFLLLGIWLYGYMVRGYQSAGG